MREIRGFTTRHQTHNLRSPQSVFLAAQLCHWPSGDLLFSHVWLFVSALVIALTRQRRRRMSSSAVAVAARAAVASAICVGAITARARLRDERSGRFAFAEARGESDEDALTQVRTFRSYPRSSERRTPTEALDDVLPPSRLDERLRVFPACFCVLLADTAAYSGVSLTSIPAPASPPSSRSWTSSRRASSRRSARF